MKASEFHRQRAKVVIPKGPSMRRFRKPIRVEGEPRAFKGVLPRNDRWALMRAIAPLHQRHSNVMDPFRFPQYRHPQGRRLARIARTYARAEAAAIGWTIDFDASGNLVFL